MSVKEISIENPKSQLISMMEESKIGDAKESKYVGELIWGHMKNIKDILPKITKHVGLQFASRCLVSLGFFKDYMQHLRDTHGAPPLSFYMNAGQIEFISLGEMSLANNMGDWTSYLNERFRVKTEQSEGIAIPTTYETSKYHRSFPGIRGWNLPGFLSKP